MSVHFKGNAKSLPRVWRDLQDEASAAYAHSPLFQKGIVAYIASLSRKASVQNLPLERFSAMFDLPHGAKEITGFTLHRQIYFSRASEILALPTTHPVESVQHPERMVGIHLHSFGEPTPDAQKTLEQYAAICDTSKMDRNNPGISFFKPSEDPKDYFRLLADQLTSTLNNLGQNGHPLTEARQHKFIVGKSKAIGKHRDRFYSFDDSPNLGKVARTILSAVWNTGTVYFVTPQENVAVKCPVGATSSQLAECIRIQDSPELGAMHMGDTHPEGRCVMRVDTRLGHIQEHTTPRIRFG